MDKWINRFETTYDVRLSEKLTLNHLIFNEKESEETVIELSLSEQTVTLYVKPTHDYQHLRNREGQELTIISDLLDNLSLFGFPQKREGSNLKIDALIEEVKWNEQMWIVKFGRQEFRQRVDPLSTKDGKRRTI